MGSATATNAPRFEVTSLNDYIFGDYELPSSTSGPDLSRETNQRTCLHYAYVLLSLID